MFKDSRKHRRYPIFAIAVINVRDDNDAIPITTFVDSISEAGLGLYVYTPLEKNTPVSVDITFFTIDGKKITEPIDGRVAWSTKQETLYFMGISFDEELNPDKQPNLYSQFHKVIGKE